MEMGNYHTEIFKMAVLDVYIEALDENLDQDQIYYVDSCVTLTHRG